LERGIVDGWIELKDGLVDTSKGTGTSKNKEVSIMEIQFTREGKKEQKRRWGVHHTRGGEDR
jgi:hypothetical protein